MENQSEFNNEEEFDEIFTNIPYFRENQITSTDDDTDVQFSEEQLKHYEECFKKLDKTQSGVISAADIGSFIRAAGLNPTLKIINQITEWLQTNQISNLSFKKCIKILERTWTSYDPFELKDAVNALDSSGNGYLTIDQLKHVLVSLGEALDEDEFKDFIKNVQVQADGTINTDDLIQLLSSDFR